MRWFIAVVGLVTLGLGALWFSNVGDGPLPMSRSEVEVFVRSEMVGREFGPVSVVACEAGLTERVGDEVDCILNPSDEEPAHATVFVDDSGGALAVVVSDGDTTTTGPD